MGKHWQVNPQLMLKAGVLAGLTPDNRGFRNRALARANCRDRSGLTISEVVYLYRPISLKDQNTCPDMVYLR